MAAARLSADTALARQLVVHQDGAAGVLRSHQHILSEQVIICNQQRRKRALSGRTTIRRCCRPRCGAPDVICAEQASPGLPK